MQETVLFAEENGYVSTLFGRKRPILDINNRIKFKKENAERIAINTRVQGTSADIMKMAMNNIQNALEAQNVKTKMLIQVHDELVFDVPNTEKEAIHQLVEKEMGQVTTLSVPLKVDLEAGPNWAMDA